MSIRANLGKMLAVGALVTVAVWLGDRVPTAAQIPRPSASASDRATFVGTYRLVFTEVKDAKGQWSRTPNFNSIGYITYADTGHMGVHIMPRNRARFAENQPTPDEALAAIRGYTAYFGPFTVDENRKIVTHHRIGTIRPGQPPPFLRYYEFTGDRLILTPVPANNGTREEATNRLVWERLPNAPLSSEEKKFVGFHKLLYTDSYRMKDGKEIFHGDRVETRANTSWIIYTPTGHMMVHLMDNKGRTDTPARSRRRPRRLPRIAPTTGTSDGSRPTKPTTRRSCCTTSRARRARAAKTTRPSGSISSRATSFAWARRRTSMPRAKPRAATCTGSGCRLTRTEELRN